MIYTERYMQDLHRVQSAVVALERLDHSRIFITGAGGLIGSALVDLLLRRNDTADAHIQVYAAGRDPEKLRRRFDHWAGRGDLHFVAYDAAHPIESTVDFDYLIHGASPANPGAYSTHPVETMTANFLGTYYMLQYAHRCGAKRVLYISSSEVYGKKEGVDPYHEQEYGFVDILNPRACYPSSKRAAETLCAAYAREYGVEAVIVRPGHVYGPTATQADNRASSQFPRDVKAGRDIVMKSPGTQLRSYCYVLDCASAVLAAMLEGGAGCAYNISNRNSVVTIRQMAQAFADAAGRKLVFENATDAEKQSYNLMDNSALRADSLEALGWYGMFDLQAGVEATLDAIGKQ